jgi:site-specific recombinase xerD
VFWNTYEEAERKVNAISPAAATITQNQNKSFVELANEWLRSRSPQLKTSSIAKYTNLLDLYLFPIFGERQIVAITCSEIIQLGSDLLKTGGAKGNGLAPKTVNSILSLLRNILEYAAREKDLPIADTKDISVKQPQKPCGY